MKSVVISIFCLLVALSGYSQQHSDIPILVRDSSFSRPVIKAKGIRDSVIIGFKVILYFENPLKDTTKCIILDSIKIDELQIRPLKKKYKRKEIVFIFEGTKMTPYQKYIWDLCSEKLIYWYKNQDYETTKSRDDWENKAVFGGSLTLVPDTTPSVTPSP